MEEKELSCRIPRNLNKPDIIVHSPIKLGWKQIVYIGAGVGGAYLAFQTGLPQVYKIALMATSCGIGMICSLIKYEDSTIDELVVDSLHYVQKKNIYKQLNKRGDLIVRIKTKQEETTVSGLKPITIAVSTN